MSPIIFLLLQVTAWERSNDSDAKFHQMWMPVIQNIRQLPLLISLYPLSCRLSSHSPACSQSPELLIINSREVFFPGHLKVDGEWGNRAKSERGTSRWGTLKKRNATESSKGRKKIFKATFTTWKLAQRNFTHHGKSLTINEWNHIEPITSVYE